MLWHQDVLRFSDTDPHGHVNNTVFSVFCESGRVNYLRSVLAHTREPGGYFVLAHVSIDYLHELAYPGTVSSATWIRRLGRTSVGFGQVLVDGTDRAVARSEAVSVAMDGATRRPVPFSEATRVAVGRMLRDG